MPRSKVTSEDARRILQDAPADKAFWVNNGPVLKNLAEMASAMKKLSADQFAHHVSQAKNDFAIWTEDVIRDSQLGKKLRSATNKDEIAKAVTARIRQLKQLLKAQ